MTKLIVAAAAAAFAAALWAAPALAKAGADHLTGYGVQSFTFDDMANLPKGIPDDYVTVLCVTCRHVHLVSPTSRELKGEGDE